MNGEILSIREFAVQELFINDVDGGYAHGEMIPIYYIKITNGFGASLLLNEVRLLNISLTTNGFYKFKFISMNKFLRRCYNLNCGYTNCIIDIKNNTITCASTDYMGPVREKSGKVTDSTTYIMNREVVQFFFYLYKKYKDVNKMPSSRI